MAKFTAHLLCNYSPLPTHKMKQLLRKSIGLQVSTTSQGSWGLFVRVSDKSRLPQQENVQTPPSSPQQLHFHTCFLTAEKRCSALAVCWQHFHIRNISEGRVEIVLKEILRENKPKEVNLHTKIKKTKRKEVHTKFCKEILQCCNSQGFGRDSV